VKEGRREVNKSLFKLTLRWYTIDFDRVMAALVSGGRINGRYSDRDGSTVRQQRPTSIDVANCQRDLCVKLTSRDQQTPPSSAGPTRRGAHLNRTTECNDANDRYNLYSAARPARDGQVDQTDGCVNLSVATCMRRMIRRTLTYAFCKGEGVTEGLGGPGDRVSCHIRRMLLLAGKKATTIIGTRWETHVYCERLIISFPHSMYCS